MLAKFAWRNVLRNRRRSIVSMSSIATGVFGLFFLDSFFSSLMTMHRDNAVKSRFGHGQIHTVGYMDQSFERPWEHWITDATDLRERLRSLPEVDEAYPRVQFFALLSNGSTNVAGRGQGIVGADEMHFFDRMNIVEGQMLEGQDDGIVIGIGLARSLNVSVGDQLTVIGNTIHGSINAVDVRVSGIFHMGFKEADDMLFQIQLDQAQILLDTTMVESFAIAATHDDLWPAVEDFVASNLAGLEALSVNRLDQVWAENGERFLGALLNIFRLVFIGLILLAIYNSSSMTILERSRELAMLRANGESVSDLFKLTITESALIASLGGIFGLVLTLGLSLIFADGVPMPPTPGTNRELPVLLQLDAWRGALSWGLATTASIAATVAAAMQITSISIAKALKSAG